MISHALTRLIITLLSVPALGLLSRTQTAQAAITFTKLANLGVPVPGRPGEVFVRFWNVGTDGTTVVFVGESNGQTYGVYTIPITGGSIVKIADTTTTAPGGGGRFIRFGTPSQVDPVVRNGRVVFWAGLSTPGAGGIYSAPARRGTIIRVATYRTPIPGGAIPGCPQTTLDFIQGSPFISAYQNKIAFSAASCGGDGSYTVLTDGNQKQRVGNGNTPIDFPNANFPSSRFSFPAIFNNTIVFTAGNVFGPTGIFVAPIVNRQAKALATIATPYPGVAGKSLAQFGGARVWKQAVVFAATGNNGFSDLPGLFLSRLSATPSTAPRLIANTNTTVPTYGGKFSSGFFGYSLSGTSQGSRVVFQGGGASIPQPQLGIFQYYRNRLSKVVAPGDTIAGQKVCLLNSPGYLSSQALSGDKLAFATQPWGGCGIGGLFVADLEN